MTGRYKMRFGRLFWTGMSILLLVSVTGTLCAQTAALRAPSAATADRSTLAIGPGDMLEIDVYDVPELVLKARVGEDGNVSLPLVGTLHWAGMTVAEAQRMLARKLVEDQYVKAPQVSIFVAEYATQGISVTGEVNQPGIYPLFGPHTLFDAISAAGGFTENAGGIVTITHRDDPRQPERVVIGRNGALQNPSLPVQPGDMVSVAKAGIVYVVGEVNRPGGFVMNNNSGMSVVRAIALAMGTTPHARLSKVCIVRRKGTDRVLIEFNLKKMMKGKMRDLPLQADDIVYVPTSGVRTATDMVQKATIGASEATVLVLGGIG